MPAPSFQFTMRTGPAPGKVFALTQAEIGIGRDVSNDFIINDVEVSRRHARMVLQGTQYVLEDLGSTNGTFVNGQRLAAPHVLRPGDIVLLGENVTLVFEEVQFDPNATVASPALAAAQAPPAQPAPPPPVYQPPPVDAYAQGPTGDLEGKLPQQPPERNWRPWILAGCGCLTLVCILALGALWYIGANYLWCTVFPFIPACP